MESLTLEISESLVSCPSYHKICGRMEMEVEMLARKILIDDIDGVDVYEEIMELITYSLESQSFTQADIS